MKYILEIDEQEMDAFIDTFVAGLKPNSKINKHEARIINKVSAIGTKYENDRLAGVK